MSFEEMLVHRATIKRRRSGTDRFGQPFVGKADYTTLKSSIPSRLTHGSGGEGMTERTVDVVTVTYRLALPAGVDIQERDRVVVKSATGSTLLDDANVQHVRVVTDGDGIEHHREASLQVIRSGAAAQ